MLEKSLSDSEYRCPYQSRIYCSIRHRFAIVLDIIQHAVGDLEDSLVYNIARRSDDELAWAHAEKACQVKRRTEYQI